MTTLYWYLNVYKKRWGKGVKIVKRCKLSQQLEEKSQLKIHENMQPNNSSKEKVLNILLQTANLRKCQLQRKLRKPWAKKQPLFHFPFISFSKTRIDVSKASLFVKTILIYYYLTKLECDRFHRWKGMCECVHVRVWKERERVNAVLCFMVEMGCPL